MKQQREDEYMFTNPYADLDRAKVARHKQLDNAVKELSEYMKLHNYTAKDIYLEIANKECPLSKRCRDLVVSMFNQQIKNDEEAQT